MKTSGRNPIRRAGHFPRVTLASLLIVTTALPGACLLPKVELVDELGEGGGFTNSGRNSFGGRSGSFGGRAGSGVPSAGDDCDWGSARCDAVSCAAVCPTNDSDYCKNACLSVVNCARANEECITRADPYCAMRENGRPKICTATWETASGTAANAPAKLAGPFIECVCGWDD